MLFSKIYHNTLKENLKELGLIFMPFLLGLVLFPSIVAIVIDFAVFDFRFLVIDLVWLTLFALPNLYFKSLVYLKIISVLFFMLSLIQIVHWAIIKGPLTITSLLVASNTNTQEALDFLDLKMSFDMVYILVYVVFFVIGLKKMKGVSFKAKTSFLTGFLALFAVVFVLETVVHGRFARKGSPQIGKVVFSFVERINLYKEAAKEVHAKKVDAQALNLAGNQTTILVIGESLSRNHMSIYGYQKETNPLLKTHNDLLLYSDVVSPHSNTLASVLSICSKSNLIKKLAPEDEVDVFDVYHSAGYKTFWLSNQSPIGVWDNMITVMANQADVTSYVNLNSNSSFEATYTASYDEKLWAPFERALKDTSSKKLIMLHLLGSHSSYPKRYPSKFQVFANDGTDKGGLINNYDNTVLYNDYVLNGVVEMAKKYCDTTVASMILLSDHGENVFDEGERCGHDYSGPLPKVNVEIPFIVWLSNGYKDEFPNKSLVIGQNRSLPFVTDDLFFSMLDLSRITSNHLDTTKSIFNAGYNSSRKRVLEDGRDYDKD